MSLVTSCPACSTRFKLVPDQLKVSDGWVRCGQCSEVFDASTRLEPDPAHKPNAAQFPVLTEEAQRIASPHTPPEPDTPTPARQEPVMDWIMGTDIPSDAPNSKPDTTAAPSEIPSDLTTELPSALAAADPTESELDQAQADITPTPDEEVGFIKAARRRARWANPWVRLALCLLALLLVSVLGLQVVRTERDRLSAQYPASREWIEMVCQYTACEIQPYRDLDAVVIDGTKFTKLAADNAIEAYQLELVLKNKMAYPVAWPSLELSLTNSQDQVILRKVFAPKEYAANQVFPAAAERTAGLVLKVQSSSLASRVSGYRAILFYP